MNRTTEIYNEIESLKQSNDEPQKKFRRRSPTMLKLQWLAERLRKIDRIKQELAAGSYNVSSKKVAKSVLSMNEDDQLPKEIA